MFNRVIFLTLISIFSVEVQADEIENFLGVWSARNGTATFIDSTGYLDPWELRTRISDSLDSYTGYESNSGKINWKGTKKEGNILTATGDYEVTYTINANSQKYNLLVSAQLSASVPQRKATEECKGIDRRQMKIRLEKISFKGDYPKATLISTEDIIMKLTEGDYNPSETFLRLQKCKPVEVKAKTC